MERQRTHQGMALFDSELGRGLQHCLVTNRSWPGTTSGICSSLSLQTWRCPKSRGVEVSVLLAGWSHIRHPSFTEHPWQNQQMNPNHQASSQLAGNWWHPGLSGTRRFLIKHSDLSYPKRKMRREGFFHLMDVACNYGRHILMLCP